MQWAKNKQGFTIVELLIVVVVIAILAAISIVSFNGVQQASRDSIRKADLANVAKAIHMYNVKNDNLVVNVGNCGGNGRGDGWMSHRSSLGGATGYTRSVIDCLKDEGYVQQDIIDPSGCTDNVRMAQCALPTTTAYMKVNCLSNGSNYVYLLARLEAQSASKPADLNSTNCSSHFWFDTYGMNYAVRVN